MALYKRPGSPVWQIDITVPEDLVHAVGKRRIRQSANTTDKRAAQQLHDKIKHELWKQDKLGEPVALTLEQAVRRWEKHAKSKGLRSIDDVAFRLNWWVEKLGPSRQVSSLSRAEIMAAVEGKMTIPKNSVEKPRPAGPTTINAYLKAIRMLLRLCAGEWDVMRSAPTISLLKEPRGRVRAISKEQVVRILGELPEHLRDPMMFALATGLRQSNAVRLRWDQIDLVRARLLVGSEEFKTGQDFGIPLNDTALQILTRNSGRHPEFVFTYRFVDKRRGIDELRPLKAIEHRTWKAALQRAEITDFRWHDLRHTWATMLLEAGVDLDELQKLGGWSSREMVMRYAHFRTAYLRGAATKIDQVLGGVAGVGTGPTPIGASQNLRSGTAG